MVSIGGWLLVLVSAIVGQIADKPLLETIAMEVLGLLIVIAGMMYVISGYQDEP